MQAVELLGQNPPVLNWGRWLTQVVLNNGCKIVVVVLTWLISWVMWVMFGHSIGFYSLTGYYVATRLHL